MLRLATINKRPIPTSYSTFGTPDFGTPDFGGGTGIYTYLSGSNYAAAGSGAVTMNFLVPISAGYFVWPQSTSPIVETDLDNDDYYLTAPLNLTVEHDDDEYVVSLPEAELSRSGETAQDALTWLKSSIIELYELYSSENNLGPLPTMQLAVFEKYIGKKPNRASRRA